MRLCQGIHVILLPFFLPTIHCYRMVSTCSLFFVQQTEWVAADMLRTSSGKLSTTDCEQKPAQHAPRFTLLMQSAVIQCGP